MPEDVDDDAGSVWRPSWRLPASLRPRLHILRNQLGYGSVQDWVIDVLTWAADAQEAERAEQERQRRSR